MAPRNTLKTPCMHHSQPVTNHDWLQICYLPAAGLHENSGYSELLGSKRAQASKDGHRLTQVKKREDILRSRLLQDTHLPSI